MVRIYSSNGSFEILNLSVSGTGGGAGSITISAGTESNALGSVIFSNSNNVTFGLDGSTITASFSTNVPGATSASISAGASSETLSNLVFSNSNNFTFGLSQGTITASYTVPTVTNSKATVSAGASSETLSNLVFSNSNNVTFGLSQGTITASYTVPSVTNSSWTVSDANTSQTIGLLAFTNSNGLTMSLSTSNNGHATVIGSYTVPSTAGLLSNIKVSAGTLSANRSDITFADSNGVTWGLNTNGVVTASVQTNYLSSQSNQALSAANGSFTFQTATFANSNGVSFSTGTQGIYATVATNYLTTAMASDAGSRFVNTSAGLNLTNVSATFNSNSISISVAAQGLTSQSNQALSAANGSFTFQTATFANSNGVSFSTGTQGIYATVATNYLTSQSNQALSGSNGSFTFQTATFGNLNGMSFYSSNGSLVGSYTVPTLTNSSLSITAGNGSSLGSLSQLYFANSNNFSWGLSTSNNGSATLTASFNPAGANGIGGLANSQTTYTSGTVNLIEGGGAITIQSTTGQSYLVSVPQTSSLSGTGQVSISVNASTISIGVPNPLTLSYWNPQDAYVQVTGSYGNSSLMIQPAQAPNVQFDRFAIPVVYSNASNSSNSFTCSMSVGIYTKNGSSISLLFSTSTSFNVTNSGTAGSYSNYGGVRLLTIPYTTTLTEGQYWYGMVSRTTTGGGAGMTLWNIVASQQNSSFSGIIGAGSNATNQYTRGFGKYSANTLGLPSSIGFSEIQGNSSNFLRQPMFYVVSQTF